MGDHDADKAPRDDTATTTTTAAVDASSTTATATPHDDAAAVVYAALRDASRAATRAGLAPLPAYTLYKTAREEELCCYRSLCRVLAMHADSVDAATTTATTTTATTLPKASRRLLEDVGELLCIPAARAALEWQLATQDSIVRGVAASRVLQQRGAFFDGVDDVTLDAAIARAEDDGRVLYGVASSATTATTKREDGASSYGSRGGTSAAAATPAPQPADAAAALSRQPSVQSVHAAAPATTTTTTRPTRKRSSLTSLMNSIARIGKEVEDTVQQYLYCTEARVQGRLLQTLEEKRQALLQLRQEVSDVTA